MKMFLKAVGYFFATLLISAMALFSFRYLTQNAEEHERRITTLNGVEEAYALDVRGIKQWIEIRGQNKANPVILIIHGGPGAAMRPWGYTFQTEWEENFTIVHWDQRCGGKTYSLNKEQGCGALSIEALTEDGVTVIRHLLERLGKEKLIIVAHSWGTAIGLKIAKDRPELLYAYVGSGQMVDSYEAQRVGFQWTLEQARKSDNTKATKELQALAPFDPDQSWGEYWKWLLHFGGENYTHRNEYYMVWKFLLSPGVPLSEMRDWLDGNALTNRELRDEEHSFQATGLIGKNFEVPVFFFLGRHDYNTPLPLARDYLEGVSAPHKALVVFEGSAHSPMWEESDLYLEKLKEYILPLIR